ncbi:hypothetical protein UFOVP1320_39 [uncultured Caudovirales phage]|uniref:Uncharacterized protein n=1 Tax=uncultured Caudovirales phage TaxID=2100421 RepID=A0A6J5RZX6_9CAUD|nr:hypothetical protein UFOVP548_54 [uncultured Caudovirales phage]CAB4170212.1 hypothetical protein UFOVP904_54 [uncultured Caudovirales phage]CAB4182701.1 hypothetical protein UFOVP1079_35 [uncultured Caudovirales phage]CAB4197904.1 hypothetical protein UFOVP1320_39 [uncultured Caudovirales phage]CAB4211671.1 hypothetical protein UFOVP1431_16 [uncultured Caudovirales phage]
MKQRVAVLERALVASEQDVERLQCELFNTKLDRSVMISYLLMKVRQEDWHGVSDAANDLREMDAREGK